MVQREANVRIWEAGNGRLPPRPPVEGRQDFGRAGRWCAGWTEGSFLPSFAPFRFERSYAIQLFFCLPVTMHACVRPDPGMSRLAPQAEDAARKRLRLGVSHNLRVRAMHGNKALLEVSGGKAQGENRTGASTEICAFSPTFAMPCYHRCCYLDTQTHVEDALTRPAETDTFLFLTVTSVPLSRTADTQDTRTRDTTQKSTLQVDAGDVLDEALRSMGDIRSLILPLGFDEVDVRAFRSGAVSGGATAADSAAAAVGGQGAVGMENFGGGGGGGGEVLGGMAGGVEISRVEGRQRR